MDLLLWRCADTVKPEDPEYGDSLKTPLSERGRRQAQRVGSWIRQHPPKGLRVFTSPATAAIEMARLVSREARVTRRLGPDAQAPDVLSAVGWPDDHSAVLVVGHQPALGALAALLLAGAEAPWTIKKGAVWWFSNRTRAGETQTILRAVVGADVLHESTGRVALPLDAASARQGGDGVDAFASRRGLVYPGIEMGVLGRALALS